MKFFLTFGTHHFLKTIYEKHKEKHPIYLLDGDETSLLIVEKKGRSLFQSGKGYTIAYQAGDFQGTTFFVMKNMPVPLNEIDTFTFQAKKRAQLLEKQAGCTAVRFLLPTKKRDSFILLSAWDSAGDFRRFQSSPDYEKKITFTFNPQQLFTGKAYEKTYVVYREELEDETR